MIKHIFYSLFILFLVSCEKSDLLDTTGKLVLKSTNLPKIESGYEYRVWLHTSGFNVLAGSFNIQTDGTQSPTLFQGIDVADLNAADSIYITIDKTSNSGINKKFIIMAGKFSGDNISLTSTDSQSILNDFSGKFQFKTPTTITNTDEKSGIWFYNTSNISTLNLSTKLSPPFKYQAWLQITANSIIYNLNMGSFTTSAVADDFNSYSSTENTTPSFPGEDFITNINGLGIVFPLDISNYSSKLMLQLVPSDYTSEITPFGFTVLKAEIASSGLVNNTDYNFTKEVYSATGNRK